MFWNSKKTLITHNGGFHSDDIFACASLQLYLEKIGEDYELIRTRDESVMRKGDFVFDVGGVHSAEKNRFDHHQKGGAGSRENGVPFAAFGLVWQKFGHEICGSKEVADEMDKSLVQAIDAHDNGVDVYKTNIEGVSPLTFQDIVGLYYPHEDAKDIEYDRAFNEVVLLAKRILQKSILKIKNQIEVNQYMAGLYEKSEDKRLIVVEKKYSRHKVTVGALNLPEVLYVVYPAKVDSEWNIVATRKNIESMESKKPFPGSWAGLSGADLQKVSGVPTAKFCHNGRFLCVAEKREDAIELATLAIKG